MLRAWQRGQTGFPLVDAGMRQLWAVGWMQQSLRMVCAAFLTEYLNMNWVQGARCLQSALLSSKVRFCLTILCLVSWEGHAWLLTIVYGTL